MPGSTTDVGVLRGAAAALGVLSRAGGVALADFADFELKRALAWLTAVDPRSESRKLYAVFVVRELARAAPSSFSPHVTAFFALVWSALTDPKLSVREAGVRALAVALEHVGQRKLRSREQLYGSLSKAARSILLGLGPPGPLASITTKGVLGGPHDLVHGALLVVGELLEQGGPFMGPRFSEFAELVLRYRDSKDKHVRRSVLMLLHKLAHFHPEAFVRGGHADAALTHVLSILRDPKAGEERGAAYVTAGRIALAIGPHLASEGLRPQLERIVAVVREGLLGGVGSGGGGGGGGGRRPPPHPRASPAGPWAAAPPAGPSPNPSPASPCWPAPSAPRCSSLCTTSWTPCLRTRSPRC